MCVSMFVGYRHRPVCCDNVVIVVVIVIVIVIVIVVVIVMAIVVVIVVGLVMVVGMVVVRIHETGISVDFNFKLAVCECFEHNRSHINMKNKISFP